MNASAHSHRYTRIGSPVLAVVGASLLVAACSSSGKTASSTAGATGASTTTGASATTGASPAAPTSSGGSNASVTVAVATVPGLGRVLVNGDGRTLYVLSSEKGGKVTCTGSGSCTKYWPPAVLPSGMAHGIAGNGVQASSLGTTSSPSGQVRLTYDGWPLYTYVGDSRPGQASGEGVRDSFGLWWVLGPSGAPITTTATSPNVPATPAPTAPTTSTPASGGAGF